LESAAMVLTLTGRDFRSTAAASITGGTILRYGPESSTQSRRWVPDKLHVHTAWSVHELRGETWTSGRTIPRWSDARVEAAFAEVDCARRVRVWPSLW